MDQGNKFCVDKACKVHEMMPNGLPAFNERCCVCGGPLAAKEPDEPVVIKEQIVTKTHRPMRKHHFWKSTSSTSQKSIIRADRAIIIFVAGILKSDFDKVRGKVSLKFLQTQFGELNLAFEGPFNSRIMHYEGNDFIILDNIIKLGAKILSSIEKSENFLSIPYKYYLDEEGENLYIPHEDCSRTLIIDNSNFSENNIVTKYDMIILPDGTQSESDFTDPLKRLMISFNLFIPPIRDLSRSSFMEIGNNIRDVLFPLCYGYYNEKRFFKTNKNWLLYDSEEKVHELSIDLLKNWLMQALNYDSSIPFHSKFLLLFLTFEKELIQPFSDELFLCLLHTMSSQKYLTLLHDQSRLNGLLSYQSNIISSPLILHDAMKYIAEQEIGLLINFLPLYHIIFDSQTEYEVACNKHEFENNEFWGLPLDTEFQCNNKIEMSIIHNAIENFCIVDPLLANSIILLSMSDDSFPQLLELFPTHLLSFMCVLLYRVRKWPCFIEQDYKLRESVFITFLDKSEQIEHLSMNEEDICQTCDVIFKMLVVINDEDETQHCIHLEESKLILRVLARLLSLFDEKFPQLLSDESFHLACKKIFNLVSAKTLLKIVGECLNPDVLNSRYTSDFVSEVADDWDSLYKIHYPESYEFVFAIDELFRKKLAVQDLGTILDALVNLCISYTQISPSDTLKDSLCNEVMFELNESQTPEQDYEMCVRCLVEVPIKRFNLIAEIFTKLFECISKLLKCDPVKYILSTTWWPKFINYCQPKHFEELGHDDAATLIELVISTGKSLVTSFQDQSIKTKDLELIFKFDHNFFNLLQSVSGSDHELSVRTTFDASILHNKEQLETFLQFRRRMNDLKTLLDYTQTKKISQVLSYFLKLNYKYMSISSICHHLVILPGSEHEAFLNKPAFVTMLGSLSHLLQSQFFMNTFAITFQDYFKENQSEWIELEIILDKIWFNSLNFVSISVCELLDMEILLSKLKKCFNLEDPVKMEEEIDHLLKAIEIVNLKRLYNEANKTESLNKVDCYFKLSQVKLISRIIFEVKEAYFMNGKFETIKLIEDLNLEDKELKSVTEDMVNIGNKLSNCKKLHIKILKQMLVCTTLFKWVSENLKNQIELDNFTDLALNQCNNSTFEINRITCFKTVCRIFAPFVFESQNETDEETFLMMLETIHYNVKSCEQNESTILEMSNDCTKEMHLDFWKQLKFKHSSIGGGVISKIKNLMSNGDLVLSFEGCLRNIEDMVSIQISRGNQQTDSKVHSLHELKEMLSEVVLIRSESHGGAIGTQFQILLEVVLKFSEVISKLYSSGSVFFRTIATCPTLLITYSCNDIQLIKEDTAFLENEYSNWTTKLKKARDKHYFLNYFTSSQIITIQMGIQLFMEDPNRRLNQQLFHLLSFIQEGLLEEDVKRNLQQFDFILHSDTISITSADSNSSFESKRRSRISFIESDSPLDYMPFNSPCTPLNRRTFIFDPADPFEVPSQNEPNDEEVNSLETNVPKSQLQSLYEKRTEKILTSLDTLERIFELFGNNLKHQVKRYFPLTFKQGEPNIIFPTNSEMLDCILSIYMPSDDGYDLPLSHEILVCSDATTLEDIEIFLRRSLKVQHYSFIFCIAFIEKLKYEIAVNCICLLNDFLSNLNKAAPFRLFFLCSDEAKHSSYMATALEKYKRIIPQIHSKEELKALVFKRISQRPDFISDKAACKVDPEKYFIRVVTSESAGNGKSLTILRRAEELKYLSHSPDISSLYTIITIHESEGFEDKAVQMLIQSQQSDNEYGRIYHFDLVSISDKQLVPFLFKLLVTRTLCDNSKNVWCCNKNNYYMIEINLKSRSTQLIEFLHLFPTWDCLPPDNGMNDEKEGIVTMTGCQVSRCNEHELRSDVYKRTNAYLLQLKNKLNMDKFKFDPKTHSEIDLKILVEYSGLENPSWSEINHFLSFLNNQLIACEKNIYFQSVDLEKSWFGFKKFLIDCLILMSRDFTTPSLRISLQPSTPLNDLLGYSINYDRRWEQKKNPYIFFNEDLQTMTFLGISISKNLDLLDSFDSNRLKEKKAVSRQLYNTLKMNQVDLDEDCNSWDRSKIISVLANVMGIQFPIDPDPYYVLTIDNLKKMLAIQMRFRSNIPVILMGETGCGKTRLINFMCQLQVKSRDIQNFIIFKIHGEIYKEDIYAHYLKALALANENVGKNIDTILFFDEVNTSYSIGLIKEILCDRRIDGERIPNDLRLQFVAACNPYRRHTEEMLKKLTSAGLGMFNTSDKVREHFGKIPLRELVYRVLPLPDSLLPLVWDFGTLDPESERSYIRKIVDIHLSPDGKTSSPPLNEAITTVLYSAQMFMREKDDECSFVSLRDVERTLKVMLWFQKVLPKLSIDTELSFETQSLILAIAVCYRAKLRDRAAFDSSIIAKFNSPLDKITDASLICTEIEMFQDFLISLMTIKKHIAKNRSLKENLFMMFVCIQLKIPLFIIGKPGTSKSLAKHIISHSLNGDFNLNGTKIVEYTQIYMRSYQCSQLTTSKEILNLFESCQTIQEESAADCVACVVLDEVGLAEDSPSLPLKILHPLLEDGINEINEQRPNIAFIGLSNWALDPAKMNRGIMLQLEEPKLDEIVDTAYSIIKSSEEDINSLHMLITYIPSIAEGYLELIKAQQAKLSKDYFGLRDFYHLIKMLCLICKQYGTFNNKIMDHVILRNFGGIAGEIGIHVVMVFKHFLFNLEHSAVGPQSDILSLVRSSLLGESERNLSEEEKEKQRIERSRYLLLLTENYVALDILFHSEILKNDAKVIFGSSFPLDQEYFGICHTINRIKIFMETGKVVVLTNLSNVYESLYELLNLFYVDILGKSWVDIGIGSQRIKCPVHPDFRLIVIADRNTVFDRFPPPLINRLEKHNLTFSTILIDDIIVKNIVDTLSKWVQKFVTINNNESSYKYSQDKCFIGIQKDTLPFMVYSSIRILGLKGNEKENVGRILDHCKLELLKIASPNSILRLHKSQLSTEADTIYEDYCKLKLFDLANYLHELPNIRKSHNKSNPFLSFITTYSTLLTEFDVVELRTKLNSFSNKEYIVSQINLVQFKSEQECIFTINKEISPIQNNANKRILILQCENGESNFDLLSCAKYKVAEIIAEMSEKLNSDYYFVFITKFSFCQDPQYYSSFCGGDWDSVYIDELRDSYHNMLPSFNQLSRISVAEIFDFQHSVLTELFHTDRHIFQKKRLTRCIQKAVNRLYDPSERTDNRNADRISCVAYLLSNSQYGELADLTCTIVSHLLNRSTRLDYGKEWSRIIALQSDYSTVSTAFMKALSTHIDDLIVPLFGGILAIIDTNDNLDLAFSKQQCTRFAWKLIYQDESILPWNSLISERSLRSPKSLLNHSKECLLKNNKFPFFKIIYQQVNCIYTDMVMNLGFEGTREIFEDNFNQSAIGKILSSTQFDENSRLKLGNDYLRDFVLLHMMTSKDSNQLYRTLYIIMSVTASKCKGTAEGLNTDEKQPQKLPEYNIPSIHMAYSMVKDKIAFVNEAFNLGFQFHKNHLILTDKCLSIPNNYFMLQNIDFDIFKYLIDECWKNISKLQVTKDPASSLESFADYSCLIEHNWTFFKDYVEEMSFLRSKWECIKCVVLFVTHFLNEDAFRGVEKKKISIKSTSIFETAFNKLTEMLHPDEDNFKSQKSIQQILDILKYVNERILLLKSDNIHHLCDSSTDDCGCYQSLWDLFQDRAVHFFLQLLMNVTFSSDTAIKDDLLTFFIKFILNSQTFKKEKHPLNKIYLFNSKEIEPSPSLRCILLQYLFTENRFSKVFNKQIAMDMKEIYSKLESEKKVFEENLTFLVLQSLEDSHHYHCKVEECGTGISYILLHLKDDKLLKPFSSKAITHELIQSVAVIKFAIYWIVKWMVEFNLYGHYINSQRYSFKSTTDFRNSTKPLNLNLETLINDLAKLAVNNRNPDLSKRIQLYLLKTLYFHVGYGELLKYQFDWRMQFFFARKYAFGDKPKGLQETYLDLFYGIDTVYGEVLEFLTETKKNFKSTTQQLKTKIGVKKFHQNIIFALFTKFISKLTSLKGLTQSSKLEIKSNIELKKDPRIEILVNSLPKEPIDLQSLAVNIQENKLFNMPQMKISENTHLNTVFIAGVLCHVGILLQYTEHTEFLKPLTLIHYNPSALQNRFFPAIYEGVDCPNIFGRSRIRSRKSKEKEEGGKFMKSINFTPHKLGDPFCRSKRPTSIRNLTAISVALIRALMHSIFIWTLHTKHFRSPHVIGKLVESSPKNTYLDYFYLHLVQDITDVATITNKTFEEAILLVHLLFDLIIHEDLSQISIYSISTDLTTNAEREGWEYFFGKFYMYKFERNINMVIQEKMKTVILKSNNCDKDLLMEFYEDGKSQDVHSMLWRHRDIIAYEHLLQVFNCQTFQTSAKYPLLEKFLKDEPLLNTTRYLPDYARLRIKLIQTCLEYYNSEDISELSIGQFQEFINEGKIDSNEDFKNLFTSLQIDWDEFKNKIPNSGYYFPPEYFYENIDYKTTKIRHLIGKSCRDDEGLLMSLIKVLVEVHNSFIHKYIEVFAVPSSSERRVSLSLVSPSHIIKYKHQLDNVILSNATYSFRMGEGTLIHYDFNGIQNELGQRFFFSKPFISLGEFDMELPEQVRNVDYFRRLKSKIEQDELSDLDWNTIKGELVNPIEISEVISLIEMVVNFTSADGGQPNKRITAYLHETLKYPKKNNLISSKANEICCLKHLSSLWHKLTIHKSKIFVYIGQPPFPTLSPNYLKKTDELNIREFTDLKEQEGVITLMHDFIVFNLSVTDEAVDSSCNLRESLVDFSKSETIFNSGKGFNCEAIPTEFSVSQTVSIWSNLVKEYTTKQKSI